MHVSVSNELEFYHFVGYNLLQSTFSTLTVHFQYREANLSQKSADSDQLSSETASIGIDSLKRIHIAATNKV